MRRHAREFAEAYLAGSSSLGSISELHRLGSRAASQGKAHMSKGRQLVHEHVTKGLAHVLPIHLRQEQAGVLHKTNTHSNTVHESGGPELRENCCWDSCCRTSTAQVCVVGGGVTDKHAPMPRNRPKHMKLKNSTA